MVKPAARKMKINRMRKLMWFDWWTLEYFIDLIEPCRDEKDDTLSAISGGSMKPEIMSGQPSASLGNITTPTLTATSITASSVPQATPEVDEDEYSIKPQMDWEKNGSPQKSNCDSFLLFDCWIIDELLGNSFGNSSSDSESEEEIERKIHVEIKPLNNGTTPISASVDELRATVENLSLSPIGALSVSFFNFFSCWLFFRRFA
jgi:hypothetical protein